MRVALIAAFVTALLATTAGAMNQVVTLSLRQYVNANKVRVLVWFGQVSGPGRELVEVQARDCGTKAFYTIAETAPAPGGGWEIESQNPDPPYGSVRWSLGQTYRARWRDELSNTITYRLPYTGHYATKIAGRRDWKVYVNPGDKDWTGKVVELQRRSGGKWTRYKVAKLVRKPSLKLGAYNHEAVFAVPARGLTLRAFLPAKTVAPCHLPGASEPFRS